MSFLTRENVTQHCRTCLKSLNIDNNNLITSFAAAEEAPEFKDFSISIGNNEDIQKLITLYMDGVLTGEAAESMLEDYPQCVCICCYNKLQNIHTFGQKIKRSAQKLQALLWQGVAKVEIGEDENENQQKYENEVSSMQDERDIYKLLLKDALMETETVILETQNAESIDSKGVVDPDPFDTSMSVKLKDMQRDSQREAMHEESNDQEWETYSQVESEINSEKGNIKMASDALNDFRGDGNLKTRDSRGRLSASYVSKKIKKGHKCLKKDIAVSYDIQGHLHSDEIDTKIDNRVKKRNKGTNKRNKGTKNSFKCVQCSHSFAHKITLDAHVRKVHEGSKRPFKCDRCEKSYSFIGGLYTHIKEIHEAEVRSYACDNPGCGRIYTSFIAMQKHKRLKHSDTPCLKQHVCEQCGATFNQSGNLKYHRRSKHPTEAEQAEQEHLKQRFECDVCKKLFHSRYTLKYHTLQLHTNEMKYECNVCGRRMAKKFMLVQHMLVHSTDKMPCEHCGRQFIRKFELEAHVRAVHMKLKPFECQYCAECFASRKTLRHHEYIHTGEKPYVCDICGQAYRQQTCLKNHRKSHEKFNADNVSTTNHNLTPLNSILTAPAAVKSSKIVSLTKGTNISTSFNKDIAGDTIKHSVSFAGTDSI
ncbi:PREDICTED: zinc finger protein 235 [Rhagoletis zephyria]|uniref:zinc finger protein 235 n=2 Tax=Rhagoletis zephyria TaxID=28612 RepID=UPI0008117FA0|nr:PREDICTED: zinc finger protein 235 [Rhagoletis zephyria]